MNWFTRVLQKEARRFRSDDKVRFFTNPRKGRGRGLVHTPPMSYGRVVDWDSDNKRYRVVDNSGEHIEVHPRNIVPDTVTRSPSTPEPVHVDSVESLI